MGVELHVDHISCSKLTITSDFLGIVKEKKLVDPNLRHTIELLATNHAKDFVIGVNGVLRFRDRVCFPTDGELKRMIVNESYKSRLSMHPCMTKMYHDVKESF